MRLLRAWEGAGSSNMAVSLCARTLAGTAFGDGDGVSAFVVLVITASRILDNPATEL